MTLRSYRAEQSNIKTIPSLEGQWHYSPFYHSLLLRTKEPYGSWGRRAVEQDRSSQL